MSEEIKSKDKNTNLLPDSTKLFSEQEIKDIIKEFIKAYIRGQIILDSGSPSTLIKNVNSMSQDEIMNHPVFKKELEIRNTVVKMINICLGIENATEKQFQEAMKYLFKYIVVSRLNKGIIGSFFTHDIETQLKLLSNDVNEIKKDNKYYNRIDKTLEYVEKLDPYKGGN